MTMFVLIKTLWGEKSILHIPCINVLAFQRKLCLRLMRRLNSLKHVQHFDAHNSNQKEEKEKKKEENIKCTTFHNKCNITKPFELAEGKYSSQPPRVVPRKRCSENMPQFKRRTHMPKNDFNKVILQNHTSAWVLYWKFAAYFLDNIFLKTPLVGCYWGLSKHNWYG